MLVECIVQPTRPCLQFYVALETKALQKAAYSDFCIFAKFKTRNVPYIHIYGIYSVKISSQNKISYKTGEAKNEGGIFQLLYLCKIQNMEYTVYSVNKKYIASKLNFYFFKILIPI
jgi:hypothetical protein